MLKKIVFIFATLSFFVSGALVLGLFWLIAVRPGEEIRPENLQKVLAVESPVYYSDGKSKIGVFFKEAHRRYLPYDLIPPNFIKSIVAAEDQNFWDHVGIDVKGVARAMIANLKAGRVVQGGSTLTQQAAKNLFKRQSRSIQEKLKELLYAFRLEYHYSKEKILEFYANQFYVSGNGHGLEVAANYYFDKPAAELSLIECAFIAGSVKRPNYYNPFLKKNEADVRVAQERAQERTRYVLERMFQLKMITPEEFQANRDKQIVFRKGSMSFAVNTIMDLVREGIAEPEIEEALVHHGIDNVATSGIRIITTVDKGLQEYAHYALRQELSRLDVRLDGYDQEQLQEKYAKLKLRRGEKREFTVGRVVSVDPQERTATVSFAASTLDELAGKDQGVIDAQGFTRIFTALEKFTKHRWTQPDMNKLPKFIGQLQPGQQVYVSLNEYDPLKRQWQLDLEKYPELQGGLVVVKDGAIRAMVGGFENRYYNRAIQAKRLMGSVSKPLIYAAALQLGWNAADLLKNERNIFVYHNQSYIPRPDHDSPYDLVSMNWAGVKSENVATVWLLYHLSDRLTPEQFQELVAFLGLARKQGEPYAQYRRRIRDEEGILIDNEKLWELAFSRALLRSGPDLLFDGMLADYNTLQNIYYELPDQDEDEDEDGRESEEEKVRAELQRRSFRRLQQFAGELERLLSFVARAGEWSAPEGMLQGACETCRWFENPYTGQYIISDDRHEDFWQPIDLGQLMQQLRLLTPERQRDFFAQVSLDGQVQKKAYDYLWQAMQTQYAELREQEPYTPDILYQIKDFRLLASLKYVISMCRNFGIESNLEPVLSFPLGSNVLSPIEVAAAYESMIKGVRVQRGRNRAGEALQLIERIEDIDGKVIFETERGVKTVNDPQTAFVIGDILRNVARHGTGRLADQALTLKVPGEEDRDAAAKSIIYPTLGKTGTANRFRNSAYAGLVPVASGNRAVDWKQGYVISCYVGYDDNQPMVSGSTRITGSSGALPIWARVAEFLVKANGYDQQLDLTELVRQGFQEIPLRLPDFGQVLIPSDESAPVSIRIEPLSGLTAFEENKSKKYGYGFLTLADKLDDGSLQLKRSFRPHWQQ